MADQLLVTLTEAARICGIGRTRAYQMASAGTFPGVIRIGRSVRVSVRHLEEWIEASTAGQRETLTAA